MKVLKYLFLSISVCTLFVSMAFAQQTETTTTKKIYQNIEVEKFTIRQGVEFPAEKIDPLVKGVIDEFRESKKFNQVSMVGEATTPADGAAEVATLRITGEVIKFDKGNRAARYIIGMGAGKTKIIVNVKYIDVKTNEVVLEQTVDGDISRGIFGGNTADARTEVAEEIVKVAKKNFTEDKKKSKK
jgi:Domain of unknown function (DUF4410)